jgi:CheY-like chemotaxis protein
MARILVVDDQPDIADLLQLLLSRAGYEVQSAGTAEEALMLFSDRAFDLVLVDIVLPGCGGIALMQALRRLARRPRIVACSGYYREGTLAPFGGFDGFISKPLDINHLIDTVTELLPHPAVLAEAVA